MKKLIPYIITKTTRRRLSATGYNPNIFYVFDCSDGRIKRGQVLDIYDVNTQYIFLPPPHDFGKLAYARLRIFANNTNYASALLRIHTANSIKAKLRIQTDSKIQAKLRIRTTGPAQAKLYILTLRVSPRPQARLRIIADNSNYASALLRIETRSYEPAQAKLRIRTRTYNRKISMPDYYAFYNIRTYRFLP
jgi:hypothetical protein